MNRWTRRVKKYQFLISYSGIDKKGRLKLGSVTLDYKKSILTNSDLVKIASYLNVKFDFRKAHITSFQEL